LCADTAKAPYLAEAKGRYRSISFKNAEFNTWRKQFTRISIANNAGKRLSVKGYVIATRLATEEDSSKIKTKFFAEDPGSPGDTRIEDSDLGFGFGRRIVELHYANIAEKLRQPILAAALNSGSLVPEEIRIIAPIWEFQLGRLAKRRFVGGVFGAENIFEQNSDGSVSVRRSIPVDLSSSQPTFFGLEETIFRTLVKMVRAGPEAASSLEPFALPRFFYSAVSILQDGSLLSPVAFLSLREVANL